jgi:hypothetical protein
MNGTWLRFDVFMALSTVGAVSAWGDPSVRLVDVTCLLIFWVIYFVGAAGMWLFNDKDRQPTLSKS